MAETTENRQRGEIFGPATGVSILWSMSVVTQMLARPDFSCAASNQSSHCSPALQTGVFSQPLSRLRFRDQGAAKDWGLAV